jgi:hypothetical protein
MRLLGKNDMTRRPCLFRTTDVTRAFKAARAAGVTARIDVAPDGTIRISPAPEAAGCPEPQPNGAPSGAQPRSWD